MFTYIIAGYFNTQLFIKFHRLFISVGITILVMTVLGVLLGVNKPDDDWEEKKEKVTVSKKKKLVLKLLFSVFFIASMAFMGVFVAIAKSISLQIVGIIAIILIIKLMIDFWKEKDWDNYTTDETKED